DTPHRGKLYIPTVDVQGEDVELPLDPYLLGALLADGSLHGGGVQWTKRDAGVVAEMRAACERQGVELTTRSFGEVPRWGVTGIAGVLRGLGLRVRSRDKHVPPEYLVAGREQRLALLAGLFDGDGSVRRARG